MEPEGSSPHSQVPATWARSIRSMHPYPTSWRPVPFTSGSFKWSRFLRFPQQIPVYASPLSHTCYIPRPSHSSLFYHPNNIRWAVHIIRSSLFGFLHSPVTSSLLGPNIFLNILFSNTLRLRSFLKVGDQVPSIANINFQNISTWTNGGVFCL